VGEAVVIGVVLRAHGLHGLVRARATGPTLAGLRTGDPVEVTGRDGRSRRMVLASLASAGDTALLGFEGVATREDADALRGGTIAVDASRLPPADDPGEFYVRDLVGCTVVMGGAAIGTVRDVMNRPANDVLDVVDADGQIQLLPFTRDAVIGIDTSARRIELRDGLIDAATPPGTDTEGGRDAG
jgi:16S rRNA processing protein RimM